ncbi:class I SAM-dependent methyltransferase [Parafilimonas terrae]|uniref:Methyltransferase domain-containing protein n=1 Tax=Parafilimonas terrae TaxID=1465490 RepID=A0A1I5UFV5_9BACT|nr:class I SAM-dependent methyltransferase [Parafilimonas terrae]SFP93917.1 Methyltransferase domain-containing protein [Parafilimonas terrae]
MKSLREIYEEHNDRLMHKWDHYIDVYDKHFSSYRDKGVVFVEIGVAHGGSLQMWRKYFGEKALLIGIDINPECKRFEEGNTKIFIGSQTDEDFLNNLKSLIPPVDILIDDGGHTMKQQITTFKTLFDHVKPTGLYVCEDLHTSYWYEYGGGLYNQNSFINFSKKFIDSMHAWYLPRSVQKRYFNNLTTSVRGLHFYDSMLIIEKEVIKKPENTLKGQETLSHHVANEGQRRKLTTIIKSWFKKKPQ